MALHLLHTAIVLLFFIVHTSTFDAWLLWAHVPFCVPQLHKSHDAQIKALEKELSDTKSEMDIMESERHDMEVAVEEAQRLKQQISQLEEQLRFMDESSKLLVKTQDHEVTRLREDLEDAKTDIVDKKDAVQEKTCQILELQARADFLDRQLAKKDADISNANTNLLSQEETLSTMKEAVKEAQDEAKEREVQLKKVCLHVMLVFHSLTFYPRILSIFGALAYPVKHLQLLSMHHLRICTSAQVEDVVHQLEAKILDLQQTLDRCQDDLKVMHFPCFASRLPSLPSAPHWPLP